MPRTPLARMLTPSFSMAARDNRKRGETPEPPRWSNEIIGILWITGGLFLLLSLVKYSPADLPRLGPLEAFADKSDAKGQNLVGPVGGVLGFLQILLFGAAAYLVPVAFIWFGVLKMAFNGNIWPRPAIGFAMMVLAACAWLHAADWLFTDWAARCIPHGKPGGVTSIGMGGFVLGKLIGRSGTLLLASSTYLIAVILVTGQQPIEFTKACCRLAARRWQAWRATRSEVGKVAAREAEYKARFANPFVAGARGYIDDVIQPHETRKRICRSLAMLKDKTLENPWRKHGNIPL